MKASKLDLIYEKTTQQKKVRKYPPFHKQSTPLLEDKILKTNHIIKCHQSQIARQSETIWARVPRET